MPRKPKPYIPPGYAQACRAAGSCAIEAGLVAKLIDNECEHLRLPGDPSPPCGCHPGEEPEKRRL